MAKRWQYQQKVEPIRSSVDIQFPADAVSGGDSGNLPAIILTQYQSIVGPLFVAAAAPPEFDPSAATFKSEYPSWIFGNKLHQSLMQTLAWHSETPATPDVPTFVDFVAANPFPIKKIPQVRLGTVFAWNTDTPPAEILTELSWQGYQPARVWRQYVHASRLPYQSWGVTTPDPVVETVVGGAPSDGGPLSKLQLIQYQAVVAPVFVATPPPPEDITFSWLYQRPDQVRDTLELSAAHGPYFFGGQIEQMTMEWLPIYPSRIWKRGRRAQFAPYFGGFGIPAPAPANTDAATKPSYPNQVWSKRMHPSRMPWIDASPNPQVEIDRQNQFAPLSWKSQYPDRIFRPRLSTANVQFYAMPSGSIIPVPHLSWKAIYPDAISRQRMLAALQRAFTSPLSEQGTSVPEAAWQPNFADQVRRKHQILYEPFSKPVFLELTVPDLVWAYSQPPYISRKQLHPSTLGAITDVQLLSVEFAPRIGFTQSVDPQWPLNLTALKQSFAYGAPDGLPVKELSWKPELPDFISRRQIHPAMEHQVFPSPQTTQLVVPLSWAACYPDRIQSRYLLTSLIPAFNIGGFGTISIPDMSWQPQYPAWMPPKQFRNSNSTINLEPIPNPPAPDLSWQPHFADSVFRPQVHASKVPFIAWQPQTPADIPFSWAIQNELPVQRILRPRPATVHGWDITLAWSLGWKGYQPEYINRRRMNERPSMFAPSFSALPAIATYAWRTIAPEWFPRKVVVGRNILPFSVDPTIIADQYDCIVIDNQDVFHATMLNEYLTVSDISDETLTPTIDGDFC